MACRPCLERCSRRCRRRPLPQPHVPTHLTGPPASACRPPLPHGADNDVAGGTVEINVSFMGMPIYTQQEDLCSKTSCPVPSGPISITLVEYLPPIAPPVGAWGASQRGAPEGDGLQRPVPTAQGRQ